MEPTATPVSPKRPRTTETLELFDAGSLDDQALLPTFPDSQLDWTEIMASIDEFVVPDQLVTAPAPPAPDPEHVRHIFQERVVYSVKQMKKWPHAFAESGIVPFINLKIYHEEYPTVISEALGMCSLYAHRNEENEGTVRNCISQTVKRLLQLLATSLRGPVQLSTRIAWVQALCLYRIIQLFDGDVTMRAEAESSAPTFDLLLKSLQNEFNPANGDVLSGGNDQWHSWLLAETIRRTLVVGYSIEGTFTYLKDGVDDHSELSGLSFYAQQSMWRARSLYQWQVAVREQRALPVRLRLTCWEGDMATAQPADLDDLSMMMMVLVKGTDPCRHWVGRENLEKFDLVPI